MRSRPKETSMFTHRTQTYRQTRALGEPPARLAAPALAGSLRMTAEGGSSVLFDKVRLYFALIHHSVLRLCTIVLHIRALRFSFLA